MTRPHVELVAMLAFGLSCAGQSQPERLAPSAAPPRPPAPGLEPVEAACASYAATLCAHEARCLPYVHRSRWESTKHCEFATAFDCVAESKLPGAPPVALIEAGASAPWSCDGPPRALGGALAGGEACSKGLQCKSAVCSKGRCAAVVSPPATCGPSAVCAPGLACADDMSCVPESRVGEACSKLHPCYGGLFCRLGTCSLAAAEGAACDDESSCGPPLDCANGRCVPRTPLRVGDRCDPPLGCPYGSRCSWRPRRSLVAWEGRCGSGPKECEPCSPDAPFRRCPPTSTCENGVCDPIGPRDCSHPWRP